MKIQAIQCPVCKAVIYSRARHDFHWCPCGEAGGVFIDGGFDYMRCGGPDLATIQHVEVEVVTSRDELYNDWNLRINKFGTILA